VHLRGPHRLWKRRSYDLKVRVGKKRLEKLNYPHGNAMKKGARQLSLLVTCHSPLLFSAEKPTAPKPCRDGYPSWAQKSSAGIKKRYLCHAAETTS
jgi:hypothetical protein